MTPIALVTLLIIGTQYKSNLKGRVFFSGLNGYGDIVVMAEKVWLWECEASGD